MINYSVIFEMLCSKRSTFLFFGVKYHIDLFFLGHLFFFQRKDGKRFRAGCPLEENLAPFFSKVDTGQNEKS